MAVAVVAQHIQLEQFITERNSITAFYFNTDKKSASADFFDMLRARCYLFDFAFENLADPLSVFMKFLIFDNTQSSNAGYTG